MSYGRPDRSLGRPAAPIVLLEDDADDAYFVCRALADAKVANPVVTCRTAAEAKHLLSSESDDAPVLFILDVLLGSRTETGLDYLEWLRLQPAPFGTTPAMMLTGSSQAEHARVARRLGATSFVTKPVTRESLAVAVQALGFVVVTSVLTGVTGSRIIERR